MEYTDWFTTILNKLAGTETAEGAGLPAKAPLDSKSQASIKKETPKPISRESDLVGSAMGGANTPPKQNISPMRPPEPEIPPAPPAAGGAPQKKPAPAKVAQAKPAAKKPAASATTNAATASGVKDRGKIPPGHVATIPNTESGTESATTRTEQGPSPIYEEAKDYLSKFLPPTPPDPDMERRKITVGIDDERLDKEKDNLAAQAQYRAESGRISNRKTWDTIIGALGQALAGGIGLASGYSVGDKYKYTPSVDEAAERERAKYAMESEKKRVDSRFQDYITSTKLGQEAYDKSKQGYITPEKYIEVMEKLAGKPPVTVKVDKDFSGTKDQNIYAPVPAERGGGGGKTPKTPTLTPEQVRKGLQPIQEAVSKLGGESSKRAYSRQNIANKLFTIRFPHPAPFLNFYDTNYKEAIKRGADETQARLIATEVLIEKMGRLYNPPGTFSVSDPAYLAWQEEVAEFVRKNKGEIGIPMMTPQQ